jgi:hypothetical protein
MLTIDQILTPATSAQIRAYIANIMMTFGIPVNKWAVGGSLSSMLTATSNFLALTSTQLAQGLTAFFLPKATGGYLQLLAVYVYNIPSALLQATFATGNVTLTNSGGGSYTQAIGSVTVSNPTTGAQYTNTAPFTLNPSSSLSISVECTVPGLAGSSNPGTVTNMVTPLSGVSVSNPVAIIGLDAPTDAQIRAMCVASLAIRSVRGPRNAYSYAISIATNSVTGNKVNINRSFVGASSTGIVTVVLASPAGAPDANDVTGVATSIEANVRPEGITVMTSGATNVNYSPTLNPTVTAPSNVTPAVVQTAINSAISSYISNVFPIGGVTADDDAHPLGFTGVLASGIYGAAAVGAQTVGATLVAMAGATDLALTFGQVAVWAGTVNTPTVLPSVN